MAIKGDALLQAHPFAQPSHWEETPTVNLPRLARAGGRAAAYLLCHGFSEREREREQQNAVSAEMQLVNPREQQGSASGSEWAAVFVGNALDTRSALRTCMF